MGILLHRRRLIARLALLVLTIGVLAGCLTPSQDKALNALNRDRSVSHLRRLSTVSDAQVKAQAWAEKLAHEHSLYHSPITAGIRTRWCALGENVGSGPTTLAVQAAYMRSSGHRANILGNYNGVGVGVARVGKTVWVVQEFIKTC